MTDETTPKRGQTVREAVASFATKDAFRAAVKQLLQAGYAPTDLSVLATHDSLEVAGGVAAYNGTPGQSLMSGLTDEVRFVDPLEVAGFSMLSGGPIAAGFAALVGAGVGAMALKEVVDRLVANRHSTGFAEALKQGGVLLWVRLEDAGKEAKALDILRGAGGIDPHINTRSP